MAFSPFLSAASHSSADIAGVDFDHWLPDSSIKLWNSEFSDSCGDGSPPSPPEPLKIHPSTNNFLLHQSFPLLNHDSLQSNNDSFLQRTFSSSLSPPPSAAIDPPINRPLFPAGDFQVRGIKLTNATKKDIW